MRRLRRRPSIELLDRLEVARNPKTGQLGNLSGIVGYGDFNEDDELAAYKADELQRIDQAGTTTKPTALRGRL